MKFGKTVQTKRQLQREEQLAKEQSEFDFRPKINQRSRSIASQKSGNKRITALEKEKSASAFEGARSFGNNSQMRQQMSQNNHIEGQVSNTHIIYGNQEASMLDQSNFVHSNLNN